MSRFAHSRPRRSEKPWLVIVCDGENTEPQYFQHLREYALWLWCCPFLVNKKDVIWTWYNRWRTVKECERVFKERLKLDKWYTEAWCVFDGDPKRDDPHHDDGFVEAVSYVEGKKKPRWLYGAYSFEAFEYWFLLHFEKLDWSPMSRDDYLDRLNRHLAAIPSPVRYDWDNKVVSKEFFQILIERVDYAIENAKSIDDWSWKPIWWVHERGSITKVYKLVERMLWR